MNHTRLLHTVFVTGRLGDLERLPERVFERAQSMAPGYTQMLHTDTECIKALGAYGAEMVQAFHLLRRGAKKANL